MNSSTPDPPGGGKGFVMRGMVPQLRAAEQQCECAARRMMAGMSVGAVQDVSLKSKDIAWLDVPAKNIEAVPIAPNVGRQRQPRVAHNTMGGIAWVIARHLS